jgi:CheY-like chemotaxis protein
MAVDGQECAAPDRTKPMESSLVASLQGRRVLIVEDELMIRMLLEDMLGDFGCVLAAEAGTIESALAAVRDTQIDVAVLDVNVEGAVITPVAVELAARGVPFVFATGYGARGLPEGFADRPVVQKPFETAALEKALGAALAGGA